MALLKFQNKGIRALCACVPKNIVNTRDFESTFGKEAIDKFIEATGIEERHIATTEQCASDLCVKAAEEIFEKTEIDREDIDIIIFVSQTPDYKSPATSVGLQNILGLKRETIVYDLNMACTGFLHGLVMGFSMLNMPEVNNVLLLVGDTLSKYISFKDKATGLLFGDAASASVLSKSDEYPVSYFSMQTDGSRMHDTYIEAGGTRLLSSPETLIPETFEDGSVRNKEQLVLNGEDVFSFAIGTLPKDIKKLLDFSCMDMDDVDLCAFHQANNFMTNYIAKKAKVDKEKALQSIQHYGNVSSASIPICISKNKERFKKGSNIVLMNAIGSGYTYGTAVVPFVDTKLLGIVEL